MSLDDNVGAAKYGDDLVRAIEGVFGAYAQLSELPAYCPVRKGDILQATPRIDQDPLFRGSQIVILGYTGEQIIGTSLRKSDRTFLFMGTWGVKQIENEVLLQNFWDINGNIGLGERALSDYFIQQNAPRN